MCGGGVDPESVRCRAGSPSPRPEMAVNFNVPRHLLDSRAAIHVRGPVDSPPKNKEMSLHIWKWEKLLQFDQVEMSLIWYIPTTCRLQLLELHTLITQFIVEWGNRTAAPTI